MSLLLTAANFLSVAPHLRSDLTIVVLSNVSRTRRLLNSNVQNATTSQKKPLSNIEQLLLCQLSSNRPTSREVNIAVSICHFFRSEMTRRESDGITHRRYVHDDESIKAYRSPTEYLFNHRVNAAGTLIG